MNKRKRIRLCTHEDIKDKLHEMFIVQAENAYIRPHKHLKKVESFHVIEGLADLILFNDRGNIKSVIRLGDYLSGNKFYYRISESVFHMLLLRSKFVVFHETTCGPFKKSATIVSEWSPAEEDVKSVKEYMNRISMEVNRKYE
jgi:cupin fold WbuC family metalloprotein